MRYRKQNNTGVSHRGQKFHGREDYEERREPSPRQERKKPSNSGNKSHLAYSHKIMESKRESLSQNYMAESYDKIKQELFAGLTGTELKRRTSDNVAGKTY